MTPAKTEFNVMEVENMCDNPYGLIEDDKIFGCSGIAVIKIIDEEKGYNVCENCHREIIGRRTLEERKGIKEMSDIIFNEASEGICSCKSFGKLNI